MSGKWTKGPWVADSEYSDEVFDEGGYMVAQVMKTDDVDELRANSNLIAAAPELYDALDGLLNCGGIRSNEPGDAPAKAVWNAMQVLAKARGEQQ